MKRKEERQESAVIEQNQSKEDARPLSPISRRALFKKMAKITLGVGVAALGGGALLNVACDTYSDSYTESSYTESYSDSSYTDNCGYCEYSSKDYTHCDGMYCNYTNA